MMKFRAYELVARAVEAGAAYGVRRAHKHTDNPSRDTIQNEVVNAIMSELCDIIDWEDEPQIGLKPEEEG